MGAVRRHAGFLLVWSILALVYLIFGWRDAFIPELADSAVYVLLATWWSPFQSANPALTTTLFAGYPFPPLYPLLLGWLGGGLSYPGWSHALTILSLLLGFAAIYWWSVAQGLSRWLAVALVGVFATAPVTVSWAPELISEPLYIALSFASLIVLRGPATLSRVLLASLLVSLALMTRSVGVALVIAGAIALAHQGWRRVLVFCAGPVLVAVAWEVLRLKISGGGYSYVANFFSNTDIGAGMLETVITHVRWNVQVLWLALVKSFDDLVGTHSTVFVGFAVLMAMLSWLRRLRHIDGIYVLLYLAILLVWPHPDHLQRLLWPLIPLFLFYGVETVSRLARALSDSRLRPALPAAFLIVFVALALPGNVFVWQRFNTPLPPELEMWRNARPWLEYSTPGEAKGKIDFLHRLHQSAARVSGKVGEDECIFSVAPEWTMLLSSRVSVAPPPWRSDDESFAKGAAACRFFFLMATRAKPDDGTPPLYPERRLEARLVPLQVTRLPGDKGGQIVSALVRVD